MPLRSTCIAALAALIASYSIDLHSSEFALFLAIDEMVKLFYLSPLTSSPLPQGSTLVVRMLSSKMPLRSTCIAALQQQ
ncbi:hypothetical protein [Mucilaginibacter sp. OK098]|uniref:hypothetical protein n=1 Tax=Mucilaginibacter sp. OK098 TaxID=1855297 RepID=UPI001160F4C4|nr:hypothetical protein [Mucilaginibacter sp. OK098]